MLLPSQVVAELCLQQREPSKSKNLISSTVSIKKNKLPLQTQNPFSLRDCFSQAFLCQASFSSFSSQRHPIPKFSAPQLGQQIRLGGFCEWKNQGVSRYFNEITSKKTYVIWNILKNNYNNLRFSFLEYFWCFCVVSHVRFWSCLGDSKAQNLQEKSIFSQGFLVANHQHEPPTWTTMPRHWLTIPQ